jgi:hypothetical protein
MIYAYFDNTPDPPAGPGPVSRRAMMVFRCEGSEQRAVIELPGISLIHIESDAPYVELDITDPAIQGLADLLMSFGLTNPFGNECVELISAYVEIVP